MLRPIEKLTINLTLNGSVSTTNGFFNEVNPMSYATNTNRIIDPDAYYMQRNGYNSKTGKIQTLSYNFINERDNSGSKARSNFMSASLDVNWRILDWVTYQSPEVIRITIVRMKAGLPNVLTILPTSIAATILIPLLPPVLNLKLRSFHSEVYCIQTTTTSIPTIFRTSYNSVKHSILITD